MFKFEFLSGALRSPDIMRHVSLLLLLLFQPIDMAGTSWFPLFLTCSSPNSNSVFSTSFVSNSFDQCYSHRKCPCPFMHMILDKKFSYELSVFICFVSITFHASWICNNFVEIHNMSSALTFMLAISCTFMSFRYYFKFVVRTMSSIPLVFTSHIYMPGKEKSFMQHGQV